MISEFIIPLKKDDLLKKSKDQYYVKSIFEFSECVRLSSDFSRDLNTRGAEAVLEHFDLAFSYLNTQDVSFTQLQEFYDQSISHLLRCLCPYVEDACNRVSSKDDKLNAVNVIRMTIYIFSLFLKTYEEKLSFGRDNFISEPKHQKGSRAKVKKSEEMWPWSDIKNEAFIVIYSFLKTPFNKLWITTNVEDQFINLIANCCYKTFENAEINQVKMKALRNSSSQVLGLLVRNFNHQLTFIPKAIQLMKQHENASIALSNAVLIMASEYECNTLLHKIIIELFDEMLEDSQILGRAAGTFISDIAEINPSLFIPSILHLEQFFSVEAYPVRIAVLVVYTEVLCHFSNEDETADTKKLRDKMLQAMEREIHDDNAYVRSKVLQLWVKLLINNKVPIEKYLNLLREVKFRIMDKSTHVSKNAIIFFKNALTHNPYAAKFQLNEAQALVDITREELNKLTANSPMPPEEMWKKWELGLVFNISTILEEEGDKITEVSEEEDVPLENVILIIGLALTQQLYSYALNILKMAHVQYPDAKDIRVGLDPENKVEYYTKTLEKIFLKAAEMYPEQIMPDHYLNQQKIVDCQNTLRYLESHIGFIQCMGEVMEAARVVMSQREDSGTESVEAVVLLREGVKFRVPQCDAAVRDMLHLINSDRADLRQAVTQTYAMLYLESNKATPHARAQQVAKRLVKLVQEMDFGQKSTLEQVVAAWLESNQLDRNFISVLLEKVKLPDVTVKEKSAILVILGMIARGNPSLVNGNLQFFTTLLEDPSSLIVQLTCDIIVCLANVDHGGKHIRFHQKNPIFQNSIHFLQLMFDDHKCTNFENLACSVVNVITQLCIKPEELCYELLRKLHQKTVSTSPADNSANTSADTACEERKVKEMCLGRLIHVCADVAYKLWFYFDKTVFNSLKKKTEDGKENEKKSEEENELAMEMDSEVAAEEALRKEVSESYENWLNNPDYLFYHIREKVVKICYKFADPSNSFLLAISAVALAKFMFCSASFCQQHFQLFATLMDKSPDERTRSSLALSFSDLLVGYPNCTEPWTPYLFARLKDSSSLLRRSTVSVLSHLVCREMVKVRGQAADMLLHLEDPDTYVSGKIRCLMIDISKKGNTLYNVVPDIISNLSNPERAEPVSPSLFKLAVEFVLGLLNNKHKESLVERLCLRIKEASCDQQRELLAHCLSLLSYGTERALRSLVDSLPSMKDALNQPVVLSTIESILTSQSKSNKPNIKELAGEGTAKLEELTGIGGEEGQCGKRKSAETNNSAEESAEAPAPAHPASTRKKRARRKRYVESSDED